MRFLLLAMLIATTSYAAEGGHSVGNGGGVICVSGVCKTLTEAGLRMAPQFNGVWIPESGHYSWVSNMISGLKLFEKARREISLSVFGRGDHFRRVEVVDPAKVEAIRALYREAMQDSGFKFDPATFQVVAFSSDETVKPALTYLLPEFFKLAESQQAQILIHEGLYRGKPSRFLKYVLQFESAMAETARVNQACAGFAPKDFAKPCVDQQILAFRLGYLTKGELFGALISTVTGTTGIRASLLGEVTGNTRDGARWVLDPRAIVELGSVEPRLPYILSRMSYVNFRYSKLDRHEDYVSAVAYQAWLGKNTTLLMEVPRYPGHDIYELVDDDQIDLVLPE